MTKIAEAALFLLLLLRCFGLEQLYREAQGAVMYDQVLAGHVIARFKTQGFLSCAHECLAYTSCKSYNYRVTSEEHGICEINGNEGNVEEDFVPEPGSLFGRMTRIQVSWSSSGIDGLHSLHEQDSQKGA